MARHVTLGSPRVDEENASARLAICRGREDLKPDGTVCRRCRSRFEIIATWAATCCLIGKLSAEAQSKARPPTVEGPNGTKR